jgi:RNA polymerase sigma-70 factor, ECF subfamily
MTGKPRRSRFRTASIQGFEAMTIPLSIMSDERGEPVRQDVDREREDRFLELFLANEKRIHAFILSLVPDWPDADDLLQETSAVLWRKLDEYRPGTDFVSWALRIAQYEVFKYRKRQSRERRRFSERTFEILVEHASARGVSGDERRDALEVCLTKLNERDRELIRLRYQSGATAQDVADRVGRSVKAVYKALNRIHEQLLQCIRSRVATKGLP